MTKTHATRFFEALAQLTAEAEPIHLTAQDYEEFIASPPAEIERLATVILVDQLPEALRLYSDASEGKQLEVVTRFLMNGLLAFAAGVHRFSGYGQLISPRREGLRLENAPTLRKAVFGKIEESRPVVENVVRRFRPLLDAPDSRMGDLPL